jgi:hypothetical protein
MRFRRTLILAAALAVLAVAIVSDAAGTRFADQPRLQAQDSLGRLATRSFALGVHPSSRSA